MFMWGLAAADYATVALAMLDFVKIVINKMQVAKGKGQKRKHPSRIKIRLLRLFIHTKQRVYENRIPIIVTLLCIAVMIPIYVAKSRAETYFRGPLDYVMLQPRQWHINRTEGEWGVIFTKPSSRDDLKGKASIILDIKIGNPYGVTALDYINNGLIPQIQYTYETKELRRVYFNEPAFEAERNGRPWAMLKFSVDLQETQIVCVTIVQELVMILALKSSGPEQDKDEQLFYKVLDSLDLKNLNMGAVPAAPLSPLQQR
jgi:hypothetical protein